MTAAAEFFSDPEVLDELAVLYCADVVASIVPTVMGMLMARGDGAASADEKLRIFRDDLRRSIPPVLRWMGDADHIERYLDQMIDKGVNQSGKIFPAVDAFLRGESDRFLRDMCAELNIPEPG